MNGMLSPYDNPSVSRGNVNTSQFGVTPFQRVEIIIGGNAGVSVDRTTPEFFPQIEGDGFYVEQCDFPVTVSLVDPSISLGRGLTLRDGVSVNSPFKGLYLSHANFSSGSNAQTYTLTLIVFKNGSKFSNDLNSSITRVNSSYRVMAGGTATIQQVAVYIPPGARVCKYLQVRASGTTVLRADIGFSDANAATIIAPVAIQQSINGVVVTYNNASPPPRFSSQRADVAGVIALEWAKDLYVPSRAAELVVTVEGTGLVVLQPSCYWQ